MGLHESASLRHTMWLREANEKADPVISFFIVCPLLIIFFGFVRSLAGWPSFDGQESIWQHTQFFICVCCPKSIWPYCAHSFSVCWLFIFYNDDRSINRIEWSAFVRASPQRILNIEPILARTHNRILFLTHGLYCVSLSSIKWFHFAIQPKKNKNFAKSELIKSIDRRAAIRLWVRLKTLLENDSRIVRNFVCWKMLIKLRCN